MRTWKFDRRFAKWARVEDAEAQDKLCGLRRESVLSRCEGIVNIRALGRRFRMAVLALRGRSVILTPKAPLFELEDNFFPRKRLTKILEREGARYTTAAPFPHVVIDGFIQKAALKTVLREFVRVDGERWKSRSRETEIKLSNEDESSFGPFTWKLIHTLNSGYFLAFLEKLTGIDGLIADSHLRGGGLHEIKRGGKLNVHADFNFHRRLRLYRRLNLLLYLNRGWKEEWGGHLELWNRDMTTGCERILPIFNRAVIFNTSRYSYHGHPIPLACPDAQSRRSIALYYYTSSCPADEDETPHTTVFQQPGVSVELGAIDE